MPYTLTGMICQQAHTNIPRQIVDFFYLFGKTMSWLHPIPFHKLLMTTKGRSMHSKNKIPKRQKIKTHQKQRRITQFLGLASISIAALAIMAFLVVKNNPPPALKGKYVKIKYVTQLPIYTPAFAFFCNLPQYVKDPYKRYLENRMREHFDFTGVPIRIFFRKK